MTVVRCNPDDADRLNAEEEAVRGAFQAAFASGPGLEALQALVQLYHRQAPAHEGSEHDLAFRAGSRTVLLHLLDYTFLPPVRYSGT